MKSEPGWTWKWLRSPRHTTFVWPPRTPGDSHRPMSPNPLGVFCGDSSSMQTLAIEKMFENNVRMIKYTYCPGRCKKTCCSLFTGQEVFLVDFCKPIKSLLFPTHQFLDVLEDIFFTLQSPSFVFRLYNRWMAHSMLVLMCPILLCTWHGCWLYKGRVIEVTSSPLATINESAL